MDAAGNTVIGEIGVERLSDALTAIHRGGHGHHARVLDGSRGDLQGQLRRAGITATVECPTEIKRYVLVMLHAPGRIAQAIDLLSGAGVARIQVVNRAGAEVPAPVMHAPIARRNGRTNHSDSPSSPGG